MSIMSTNFEQPLKHIMGGGGGGGGFNSVGLDHSGSQPFNYVYADSDHIKT